MQHSDATGRMAIKDFGFKVGDVVRFTPDQRDCCPPHAEQVKTSKLNPAGTFLVKELIMDCSIIIATMEGYKVGVWYASRFVKDHFLTEARRVAACAE